LYINTQYFRKVWKEMTSREEHRLRVFENTVFRRVFGPKRDEVTLEWRKLHNEELNDLYFSRTIVQVIKSRRIRWVGHVAWIGEGRVVYRVLVEKPEGKEPLGRPRCRWMILRWIFRRWEVGVWTGLGWLRIETGPGTCECGNETLGSIKCGGIS
jgi:hypothetical protein